MSEFLEIPGDVPKEHLKMLLTNALGKWTREKAEHEAEARSCDLMIRKLKNELKKTKV